jgi:hypothetical protein
MFRYDSISKNKRKFIILVEFLQKALKYHNQWRLYYRFYYEIKRLSCKHFNIYNKKKLIVYKIIIHFNNLRFCVYHFQTNVKG